MLGAKAHDYADPFRVGVERWVTQKPSNSGGDLALVFWDIDDVLVDQEHGGWRTAKKSEMAGIVRVRATLTFDAHFQSFTGTFVADVLNPADDPLTAEPLATLRGDILSGNRVVVA